MIGYLRGTVRYLTIDACFLEVQGVGYRVFVADAVRSKLVIGKEVQLFTYLSVREDALQLYGFFSQAEYDIFLQLLSVSGIGPKLALGILSATTVDSLVKAIRFKEVNALTKLPGIGKKTAERLILELRDKVKQDETMSELTESEPAESSSLDHISEAGQALMALGYTQAEYLPILKKAPKSAQTVEALIKFALKEFAGR